MNIKLPVSIIIPMLNSETTILLTLNGLQKQKYPIKEIIIVDNASIDNSVAVVKKYQKQNSRIPINILVNAKNKGVGGSYNRGVKKSTSKLIVLMHSDSTLKKKTELSNLIDPFYKIDNVVATYSSIILPRNVWNTYNFWQKLLSARAVGNQQPGLNGKFDCILRKVYVDIGGFNVNQYGHHINIGAEDSDLHLRLLERGKVVKAKSEVVHLHYLGKDYSLIDLFKNRNLLARSYGRLLRLEFFKLGPGIVLFFIKPFLTFILFIPLLFPINFIILFIYIFWYYSEMYITQLFKDWRIFLLPFITIILLICEVYWMLQGFLILNKEKSS